MLASAVLDMLPRPSNASLKSPTPTPRVVRAILAKDLLSICINAGDILRKGVVPSRG